MPWHAAPLGVMPSDEGPLPALIAIDDQLMIALGTGRNWGEAAARLVEQAHTTKFTVDPAFHRSVQDVAMIRGWEPKAAPLQKEQLRAVVGFSLANHVDPQLHLLVAALLESWKAFYEAKLWESLSSELGVPVTAPHTRRGVITVLGSSGIEYGLAFYDDLSMLDAVWAGTPAEISGASMLVADEDAFPQMAFSGLGVPAPVVMRVLASRPSAAREFELRLLDASLRVLLGWPQDLLELMRDEEEPKAAKQRKAKAAGKKPRAKKRTETKPAPAKAGARKPTAKKPGAKKPRKLRKK